MTQQGKMVHSETYEGAERRQGYPSFGDRLMEKWFTPATLTIVFGGVVWGVQLNFAVTQLVEEIGRVKASAVRAELRADTMSESLVRAAVILERVERRLDRVEGAHRAGASSEPKARASSG